jgi:LAO/AO transport system kinase
MSLAENIICGDMASAARLIRNIEDGMPGARDELKRVYPHTGQANILGITGSPGTGKSTLADKLVNAFRAEGKTVGVVAVDPTSPFSGGAILGDRVRMQKHSLDEGVFIRSVATRGHLGGVSRCTNDIVDVLDAMGKDVVIVETVGVGQDEVEVARMAYTTIVVLVPGLGDDVQALKAGILEVGDIFLVNKADHEGADRTVLEIKTMLDRESESQTPWPAPVLKTQANEGHGIAEVMEVIAGHHRFLLEEGYRTRLYKERLRQRFLTELQNMLFEEAVKKISEEKYLDKVIEDLVQKRDDPYSKAEQVVREMLEP